MRNERQRIDNSDDVGVKKDPESSSSSSDSESSSSSSDSDDEGGIIQREIKKVSFGRLFTQNQFNISIGFVVGCDNQSSG